MSETFELETTKTPYEAGHVSIDLSVWLRGETITNVDFFAKNFRTNTEDTLIIDAIKSTFSGVYIKPYIQNGVHGEKYIVRMHVTTSVSSKGAFYLIFEVKDF
jgi:hypothetical protein